MATVSAKRSIKNIRFVSTSGRLGS